jgi:hypothetical protein
MLSNVTNHSFDFFIAAFSYPICTRKRQHEMMVTLITSSLKIVGNRVHVPEHRNYPQASILFLRWKIAWEFTAQVLKRR